MSTRVTRSSKRFSNNVVDSPTTTALTTTTNKTAAANKRRQRKETASATIDEIESNLKGNSSGNESNAENMNVTPPKQRKPSNKQNALSPSTLLHRLSITTTPTEQNENQSDIVNVREEPANGRIDDARKVLTTGEVDELYGREKELNEITEFLSTNATEKTSASIYISGQPGNVTHDFYVFHFFHQIMEC